MKKRVRYTVDDFNKNLFYQLPKFLFEEEFKNLSNNAKIAYALLKDRHELSIKNDWINENGEIYLNYTRESLSKILCVGLKTTTRIMQELNKYKLIEEERIGLNRANRIYLMATTVDFIGHAKSACPDTQKVRVQTSKKCASKHAKSAHLNTQKVRAINTDINKTNISNTKSINQSFFENKNKGQNLKNTDRSIDQKYNDFESIIKYIKQEKNINFNSVFIHDATIEKKQVEEIVNIIAEMYMEDNIKINGNIKSRSIIQSMLNRITPLNIAYVIRKFNESDVEIKNPKSYIKSMLYNSVFQSGNAYKNYYSTVGGTMLKIPEEE